MFSQNLEISSNLNSTDPQLTSASQWDFLLLHSTRERSFSRMLFRCHTHSEQLIPGDFNWIVVILTSVFWFCYYLLNIIAAFNITISIVLSTLVYECFLGKFFLPLSIFRQWDSERLGVCLTIIHLQNLKGKPSALHSSLNKCWFILNNHCGTSSVVKGNITKTSGFILVSRLWETVAQTVIKKDKQMLKCDRYIWTASLCFLNNLSSVAFWTLLKS